MENGLYSVSNNKVYLTELYLLLGKCFVIVKVCNFSAFMKIRIFYTYIHKFVMCQNSFNVSVMYLLQVFVESELS